MFGSRCERDDGVTALSAAITGYVPLAGVHLDEYRHGEVVVRPGSGVKFSEFNDADWDAYSLATSRVCKEKRPVFVDMPSNLGITALKHLLSVIAVESGLTLMHIVGTTPEAPTLEAALSGREPLGENIVKYGEVIGRATEEIRAGTHAHIHNIESLRGRGDLGTRESYDGI